METTPLLSSEPPEQDNVTSASTITFRRRNPSSPNAAGPVSRITTQLSNIFTYNRPQDSESPVDVEHIYSYLGESVIVTFLSACCLVITIY